MSTVLVSRFLLHLQAANSRAIDMASSLAMTTTNASSLIFDRAIGSLAARITPDQYFGTDEEGGFDGSEETDGRDDGAVQISTINGE